EKTRGVKLDLQKIPLDDPATFALLQRGDAKGVFQLESDGIRDLLKRMRPDNINDLIACNALYRPGPLGGGMVEAYVNRKHAREIFGLITFFGGYGFNKSHSAAYALIGYQSAYLKAHYPPEFMAALLSSEVEDGNKRDILVQHIDDARRLGVPVMPPNVNTDHVDFTVADGRILFGLVAIKGLGRGAAEEIIRAREANGPFKDIFDFCERIDHR